MFMGKYDYSYMKYIWDVLGLEQGRDRRGSPRYVVREGLQIVLAWKVGDQPHQEVPARIVNLSLSGALLNVDATVPVAGPVWLRLPQGQVEPVEWMAAQIIRVRAGRRGRPHILQIAFRESCPYGVFTQVVRGFGDSNGPMTVH